MCTSTGNDGPEKTLYLDTFLAVNTRKLCSKMNDDVYEERRQDPFLLILNALSYV